MDWIFVAAAVAGAAVVGGALYFNIRNTRALKKNLKGLTGAVQKILSGSYEPERFSFREDKYKDVYLAINELWNWQKEIEGRQKNLIDTTSALTNKIEMRHMLEQLMPQVVKTTESNWGVFYLLNKSTNKLELKYSIGFSKNIYGEFDISIGEGFIGIAAQTGETVVIKDVPDDTIFVTKTFLGRVSPKNILVVPVSNAENTLGVIGLASIKEYSAANIHEVEFIKRYMAMAVSNSLIYESSKRLAGELKFQNQLIADLNTELEKNVSDRTILLQTIIDSIKHCGIYAIDAYRTVVAWNLACSEMYGVKKEEAIGRSIYDIVGVFGVEKSSFDYPINIAAKKGSFHEQSWETKRDGDSVFLDTDITAVYNEAGEVTGFIIVIKDYTERKDAEDSLELMRFVADGVLAESRRMMLIADESLVIVRASAEVVEKIGECVGTPIYNIFENPEAVRASILKDTENYRKLRVSLKGTDEKIDMNMVFADGTGKGFRRVIITID